MSATSLKNEKIKLSAAFTLVIFFLMMGLESASLAYKYVDFRNAEDQKLMMTFDRIARQRSFDKSIRPEREEFRGELPLPPEGMSVKFRGEQFAIYNKESKQILASPFNDDSFLQSIIARVEKVGGERGAFELDDVNETSYRFIRKDIDASRAIVVFDESRFPFRDIEKELAIYFAFALAVSVLLYFAIAAFIERTLTPVEENMKDMEQFIYNAGHELKTPLAVARSALQLSLMKTENHENVEEAVDEIDKINAIIESLIRLSTIRDEHDRTEVSIAFTVDDILKEYEEKIRMKHITIRVDSNVDAIVRAKEEYVRILIANLLSNAIKYNKEEGGIDVVIRSKFLEISDTGIGINSESLEKVFDRFYQDSDVRNKDGWGIGLSLVKKIADMYGWKVVIESVKGEGTRVKVEF